MVAFQIESAGFASKTAETIVTNGRIATMTGCGRLFGCSHKGRPLIAMALMTR
jgi:hypothetical protein